MKIIIRPEQPQDVAAIREVNLAAFGQALEADILDRIRTNCGDFVSIVATEDHGVVGHILFSPVTIECGGRVVHGMGLGPMAVMPSHQRRGIGSKLVRTGLTMLKSRLCPFVVVLGHPEYYPRFGFEPASRRGIRSQWPVPDEVFMILVLDEPQMQGAAGLARYRPEFGS
jgi:putative acetyltransferase